MTTSIKDKLLAIIYQNNSVPDYLKAQIARAVEGEEVKPSRIRNNGNIMIIPIGNTCSIHSSRDNMLTLRSGNTAPQAVVDATLYKELTAFYLSDINPSYQAAS